MRSRLIGMVGLAALGCTLEMDPADGSAGAGNESVTTDAEGSENVASVSEPLLGGWASGPFGWYQGMGARQLESFSTHVCVLSRMSGKFEGNGEWVQVWHDNSRWYLSGNSQQHGVSAEATCYPRSGFTANGTARWSSERFSDWSRGVSGCYGGASPAWLGDAGTYLSGIQGRMVGGGEWASIEQSPSATTTSLVHSHTCAQYLTGYAHSFFAGAPHSGKLATFVNASTRGDVYQVPATTVTNNGVAVLAPASTAMCYLTGIRGSFRGAGEYVQIRSEVIFNNEWWVLRSGKGAASSYVEAGARCMARDQR